MLQELDVVPADLAPVVVGRLKAMAELLAYRTDVPQEGRMERRRSPVGDELRVATFPTIMGERVAIRFDASGGEEPTLEDLGLEGDVLADLQVSLDQPAGAIFVTGPSGSGKTTTLYACLRHVLAGEPPRSIVTLEDPVERRLASPGTFFSGRRRGRVALPDANGRRAPGYRAYPFNPPSSSSGSNVRSSISNQFVAFPSPGVAPSRQKS